MKNAICNFNRSSPAHERWLDHENERLEHILLKRQMRAKDEVNDDAEAEHDRTGMRSNLEG